MKKLIRRKEPASNPLCIYKRNNFFLTSQPSRVSPHRNKIYVYVFLTMLFENYIYLIWDKTHKSSSETTRFFLKFPQKRRLLSLKFPINTSHVTFLFIFTYIKKKNFFVGNTYRFTCALYFIAVSTKFNTPLSSLQWQSLSINHNVTLSTMEMNCSACDNNIAFFSKRGRVKLNVTKGLLVLPELELVKNT